MLQCQTQFFNLLIFWINSSKFYEIHWFHVQNGDNFKVPWWVVMTLEFWWNHHTILLEKQASRCHLYIQSFHYFFYKEIYFKKSFLHTKLVTQDYYQNFQKVHTRLVGVVISFFSLLGHLMAFYATTIYYSLIAHKPMKL
jgi:hypothetical protein